MVKDKFKLKIKIGFLSVRGMKFGLLSQIVAAKNPSHLKLELDIMEHGRHPVIYASWLLLATTNAADF